MPSLRVRDVAKFRIASFSRLAHGNKWEADTTIPVALLAPNCEQLHHIGVDPLGFTQNSMV